MSKLPSLVIFVNLHTLVLNDGKCLLCLLRRQRVVLEEDPLYSMPEIQGVSAFDLVDRLAITELNCRLAPLGCILLLTVLDVVQVALEVFA